jgi:hypothetical protein
MQGDVLTHIWLPLGWCYLAQKNLIWFWLACHLVEHILDDLIDVVSLLSPVEKMLYILVTLSILTAFSLIVLL